MSQGQQDGAVTVTSALDTLLEHGPGRLPEPQVAAARTLRRRIDERLAHGDGLTVAALVGGTGVGKSALVNRLVGEPVVVEGVRRPTTDRPLAVVAELDRAATALLDWLGLDARREVGAALPSGLVLVDLPDHDSVAEQHRDVARRLAGRVDAVVAVVDPIKYARADLHDGPLGELTVHADTVTVVLNRVDELADDDVQRCLEDLTARLREEGHVDLQPLPTSARTGAGVERLRDHLADLAAWQATARRRLAADAAQYARGALDHLTAPPELDVDADRLLPALLEVTDGHRAAPDADVSYRRAAREQLRSPLGRLLRAPVQATAELLAPFGWNQGPTTVDAGRRRGPLEQALARELRLQHTVGAEHAVLGDTIEDTARDAAPALGDAVAGVPRVPKQRRWWRPVAWLRGVAELAAIVGLLWLTAIAVVGWLNLPELPTPYVTDVLPWPTLLFGGGLLARVLLAVLGRWWVSLGAARHARHVDRQVREALRTAIDDHVLAPYTDERGRYERITAALRSLAEVGDLPPEPAPSPAVGPDTSGRPPPAVGPGTSGRPPPPPAVGPGTSPHG